MQAAQEPDDGTVGMSVDGRAPRRSVALLLVLPSSHDASPWTCNPPTGTNRTLSSLQAPRKSLGGHPRGPGAVGMDEFPTSELWVGGLADDLMPAEVKAALARQAMPAMPATGAPGCPGGWDCRSIGPPSGSGSRQLQRPSAAAPLAAAASPPDTPLCCPRLSTLLPPGMARCTLCTWGTTQTPTSRWREWGAGQPWAASHPRSSERMLAHPFRRRVPGLPLAPPGWPLPLRHSPYTHSLRSATTPVPPLQVRQSDDGQRCRGDSGQGCPEWHIRG